MRLAQVRNSLALLLAAGIVALTGACGGADTPSLTLRPSSGQRGDSVTFTLRSFDAATHVHLTEDGNTIGDAAGPVFYTTDESGGLSGTLNIDHNDAFGDHEVCAVEDPKPPVHACATFTVDDPSAGAQRLVVLLVLVVVGLSIGLILLVARSRSERTAPGPTVFISYRREDTAGHAGRLRDQLADRFGGELVFLDAASIWPGMDFHQAIEHAVGASDVVLVLIGRSWLNLTDRDGRRRLDDPGDTVVAEVDAALTAGRWVVPVLVQGATMPDIAALPPSLQPLAARHAFVITDDHWSSNVDDLIAWIEAVPRGSRATGGGTGSGRSWPHTSS